MAQLTSSTPDEEHSRDSVRASYLCFPAWTQPLWTLLTGKPLPNERPLVRVRPAISIGLDLTVAVLLCNVHLRMLTAAASAIRFLGYVLTPFFMLYLTGAFRKAQVVYGHHAIHGTLFKGKKRLNTYAATVLTIVSLSQNEKEYERDHLDHHRRSIFSTVRDADASLLQKCGLWPGRTFDELSRILLLTLLSPRYHLAFSIARLASNLRRSPSGVAVTAAWMAFVFVVIPSLFGIVAACLALWLPMTILYQMSALLQFSTEHVWLTGDAPGSDVRAYAERCHGRFCGERVPGTGNSRATRRNWCRWWARTAFLHVPTRMAVLVGDLPAHDWHHLTAVIGHSCADWPSAIYERQRAIDSENSAGMEDRELWGVDNMLRYVLLSMAHTPLQPDMHSDAQQKSGSANSR